MLAHVQLARLAISNVETALIRGDSPYLARELRQQVPLVTNAILSSPALAASQVQPLLPTSRSTFLRTEVLVVKRAHQRVTAQRVHLATGKPRRQMYDLLPAARDMRSTSPHCAKEQNYARPFNKEVAALWQEKG